MDINPPDTSGKSGGGGEWNKKSAKCNRSVGTGIETEQIKPTHPHLKLGGNNMPALYNRSERISSRVAEFTNVGDSAKMYKLSNCNSILRYQFRAVTR